MESSRENREEMKKQVDYYIGYLKGYPGIDRLDSYCDQLMEIATDWANLHKVLKLSGGTFKWFPSPIEIRELYSKKVGRPESGPDLGVEW